MTRWLKLTAHPDRILELIQATGYPGVRIKVNGEVVVSHAPAVTVGDILRALAYAMDKHPDAEKVRVLAVRSGQEGALEVQVAGIGAKSLSSQPTTGAIKS